MLVYVDVDLRECMYICLMSYLFSPNQIDVFEKLNFYFTTTANSPVYGNIAVYIK